MNDDINVLALVKGSNRYVFLYQDNQAAETLRTLGRFASDPSLNFNWYDAAVLSQKVRQNIPSPSRQNRITQHQATDLED